MIMSLFSEHYKQMMDGYNKILSCIDSVEIMSQLECIPNMIDSWICLVDHYCDEIYYDKSNKSRKSDASRLGDSAKEMYESMKFLFQQRFGELSPEEYEGKWHPVKVSGFDEIGGDSELNSNDDCDDE